MFFLKVCCLFLGFKEAAQTLPSGAGLSYHIATLTADGEEYHDEVKHVPAIGEVIMPEGEHLQNTLSSEDSHKELVDFAKDLGLFFTLVVCLHHHGDHVEANEYHDADVKSLLGHNVKDKALVLVLRKQEVVGSGLWANVNKTKQNTWKAEFFTCERSLFLQSPSHADKSNILSLAFPESRFSLITPLS